MGGVISFSNSAEQTWLVAGWAFRQILDDVSRHHANDQELVEAFEIAELHSALMLDRLEPSLAGRIEAAINDVVSGILAGIIPSGITEQPYGDQTTVLQYLESLDELLGILHRSRGNYRPRGATRS
jgi:hypothetical protein